MKNYRRAWSVSLLVIACITIISTITSFAGINMPDMFTRIFGLLDICAVVVLVFTSVKLKIWKKGQ
ncbi:MAG: hypothetical protein K6G30_10340 [Acetatifactor sp.]|nr:hypothetical protein [Acetatifactor sp.]